MSVSKMLAMIEKRAYDISRPKMAEMQPMMIPNL